MTLQEIIEAAEKATPGPYDACGKSRGGCPCGWVWSRSAESIVFEALHHRPEDDGMCRLTEEQQKLNMMFLAMCSPERILALARVAVGARAVIESKTGAAFWECEGKLAEALKGLDGEVGQ